MILIRMKEPDGSQRDVKGDPKSKRKNKFQFSKDFLSKTFLDLPNHKNLMFINSCKKNP